MNWKTTAGWNCLHRKPSRANVTATPSRTANLWLRYAVALQQNAQLWLQPKSTSMSACFVLFCNGFERKSHLVSSSARILKMYINGTSVGVH